MSKIYCDITKMMVMKNEGRRPKAIALLSGRLDSTWVELCNPRRILRASSL